MQIEASWIAPPPRWPTLSPGARGPAVATLEMALGELGYLPVTYPTHWRRMTPRNAFSPPAASWHWSWRFPHSPPSLTSLWLRNAFTTITQGALMQFQSQNNMLVPGVATPAVFGKIAYDLAHHIMNHSGYTFWYKKALQKH